VDFNTEDAEGTESAKTKNKKRLTPGQVDGGDNEETD
jgi:hypothetical protein